MLTPAQKDMIKDILDRLNGGMFELRGVLMHLPLNGERGKVSEFADRMYEASTKLREELRLNDERN